MGWTVHPRLIKTRWTVRPRLIKTRWTVRPWLINSRWTVRPHLINLRRTDRVRILTCWPDSVYQKWPSSSSRRCYSAVRNFLRSWMPLSGLRCLEIPSRSCGMDTEREVGSTIYSRKTLWSGLASGFLTRISPVVAEKLVIAV
ncbi:hypothetical protein BJ742DRAFT_875435 [Cladochytrium replicatum]|nr:hypothetical protein BJ742DRAFT_875435 [Cladochytrium replicatum]